MKVQWNYNICLQGCAQEQNLSISNICCSSIELCRTRSVMCRHCVWLTRHAVRADRRDTSSSALRRTAPWKYQQMWRTGRLPVGPTAAPPGERLLPAVPSARAGPPSSSSRWRRVRSGLWTRSRWEPWGRPPADPPLSTGRGSCSGRAATAGPTPFYYSDKKLKVSNLWTKRGTSQHILARRPCHGPLWWGYLKILGRGPRLEHTDSIPTVTQRPALHVQTERRRRHRGLTPLQNPGTRKWQQQRRTIVIIIKIIRSTGSNVSCSYLSKSQYLGIHNIKIPPCWDVWVGVQWIWPEGA